jgi:hypothetical protein
VCCIVPAPTLGARAPAPASSAEDSETGKKVAIKKIPNTFNDLTDAKRILREIKLMRHFEHENVGAVQPTTPSPPPPPPPSHPLHNLLQVPCWLRWSPASRFPVVVSVYVRVRALYPSCRS